MGPVALDGQLSLQKKKTPRVVFAQIIKYGANKSTVIDYPT
jgi:hypothetical protein